ncbi:MAG: AMP-dependent synthetase, partial [Paracoccaceae bacterium]
MSPLEVDGILSDHPAVGQCMTFAVPHPKLGEDVGADVVLKEGQSATDREIRDFAGERLAAFKVPRKILI